uniref:Uncharacterized protein n=1 Tax=Setaria italica TaxID=4555 RepID=K3Y3S3_SETIT
MHGYGIGFLILAKNRERILKETKIKGLENSN